MHEKYSINLIPPAQEKQNPIQKSQEVESIRMAKAEGSNSICNPNTQGAHPRNLPHTWPGSLGASATGHSSGACNRPGALTHTLGPAGGRPCRALRVLFQVARNCSAASNQRKLNIQLISTKSKSLLGSVHEPSFREAPTWPAEMQRTHTMTTQCLAAAVRGNT